MNEGSRGKGIQGVARGRSIQFRFVGSVTFLLVSLSSPVINIFLYWNPLRCLTALLLTLATWKFLLNMAQMSKRLVSKKRWIVCMSESGWNEKAENFFWYTSFVGDVASTSFGRKNKVLLCYDWTQGKILSIILNCVYNIASLEAPEALSFK